jgi:hypothetical protein
MTDSELVCPYCESGDEPRWKGYVPLYDRDYQRRFLLISQGVRESVKEIEHLQPVRCTRAKSSKASVVIRLDWWTTKACPRGDGRDVEADIEPVLFTIWKDAVLREWWIRKEMEKISVQPVVVSDKPVSLAPIAKAKRTAKDRMIQPPPKVEAAPKPSDQAAYDATLASLAGKVEMMKGAALLGRAFTIKDQPGENGHAAKVPKKG